MVGILRNGLSLVRCVTLKIF